jgi:hypothetical protein
MLGPEDEETDSNDSGDAMSDFEDAVDAEIDGNSGDDE